MTLAWTIINCLLEPDVLGASKKIKRAERGGGIGQIEKECADHPPRTCQPQPISLRPARSCEGSAKLLERPYEPEVDGVAGQSVARYCEARYTFALEDFEP